MPFKFESYDNDFRLVLPPLPYAKDALAPFMSAETIDYHYGKHNLAYINKTNALVTGSEFENKPLEEVVTSSSGSIYNNAAQVWNHAFFWNCMTAKHGQKPNTDLFSAIVNQFGSFEQFKEQFTLAAVSHFGSGWVWLAQGANKQLSIEITVNAANLLGTDKKTLLACDVWEHSYYIDTRNDKAKYVENFFQIINWEFVGQQFSV